jgi:hypothetical protein
MKSIAGKARTVSRWLVGRTSDFIFGESDDDSIIIASGDFGNGMLYGSRRDDFI